MDVADLDKSLEPDEYVEHGDGVSTVRQLNLIVDKTTHAELMKFWCQSCKTFFSLSLTAGHETQGPC